MSEPSQQPSPRPLTDLERSRLRAAMQQEWSLLLLPPEIAGCFAVIPFVANTVWWRDLADLGWPFALGLFAVVCVFAFSVRKQQLAPWREVGATDVPSWYGGPSGRLTQFAIMLLLMLAMSLALATVGDSLSRPIAFTVNNVLRHLLMMVITTILTGLLVSRGAWRRLRDLRQDRQRGVAIEWSGLLHEWPPDEIFSNLIPMTLQGTTLQVRRTLLTAARAAIPAPPAQVTVSSLPVSREVVSVERAPVARASSAMLTGATPISPTEHNWLHAQVTAVWVTGIIVWLLFAAPFLCLIAYELSRHGATLRVLPTLFFIALPGAWLWARQRAVARRLQADLSDTLAFTLTGAIQKPTGILVTARGWLTINGQRYRVGRGQCRHAGIGANEVHVPVRIRFAPHSRELLAIERIAEPTD